MSITIVTNHRWRRFLCGGAVPTSVMNDQFPHLDDCMREGGFIHYRDWWYHLSDFEVVDRAQQLHEDGWQGYLTDTAFSGIALRINDAGDEFQICTWSV
jgi:hypothetical protein